MHRFAMTSRPPIKRRHSKFEEIVCRSSSETQAQTKTSASPCRQRYQIGLLGIKQMSHATGQQGTSLASLSAEWCVMLLALAIVLLATCKTLWPSGLRRWLKAPVRKGVGSNPTGVTSFRIVRIFVLVSECHPPPNLLDPAHLSFP